MAESESTNYKIEQNAWQELRRTMKCLSDRPFQIMFISIQLIIINCSLIIEIRTISSLVQHY